MTDILPASAKKQHLHEVARQLTLYIESEDLNALRRGQFYRAIRDAADANVPQAQIAEVTRLSPQRISQIVGPVPRKKKVDTDIPA